MGWYFNKEFALWKFEGHFRQRRDKKLKELDVAYQRALENNDESEKQNIVNQKNFLIYTLVYYQSIEVVILTSFNYIMVRDIVV